MQFWWMLIPASGVSFGVDSNKYKRQLHYIMLNYYAMKQKFTKIYLNEDHAL